MSIFVIATDGKWYKNPVLASEAHPDWYLHFREQSPPEFMLAAGAETAAEALRRARRILGQLGVSSQIVPAEARTSRPFPPLWDRLEPAYSFTIDLVRPLPASHIIQHRGVFDAPSSEAAVVYAPVNR